MVKQLKDPIDFGAVMLWDTGGGDPWHRPRLGKYSRYGVVLPSGNVRFPSPEAGFQSPWFMEAPEEFTEGQVRVFAYRSTLYIATIGDWEDWEDELIERERAKQARKQKALERERDERAAAAARQREVNAVVNPTLLPDVRWVPDYRNITTDASWGGGPVRPVYGAKWCIRLGEDLSVPIYAANKRPGERYGVIERSRGDFLCKNSARQDRLPTIEERLEQHDYSTAEITCPGCQRMIVRIRDGQEHKKPR